MSMLRTSIVLVCAILAAPAIAQNPAAAVKACQAHAERELHRNGMTGARIVIDADADLLVDKTTQKLGTQPIISILRGNGALVQKGHPATELTFTCLLADETRAVLFDWLQRRDAPVLAQCRRNSDTPTELGACFEQLQKIADLDLLAASANRFQTAIEADRASGGSRADDFRAAAAAWRSYREAECRSRVAGAGADAGNLERACIIQLTRRRAHELREGR